MIEIIRDDLLLGGTKGIIAEHIIQNNPFDTFIYASPVYGGFQIALSIFCKKYNKKCVIFCARRKTKHRNTLLCESYGATIIEIFPSYLSVIQKRARDYDGYYIDFGAFSPLYISLLSSRVRLLKEPDEIWCAVGSGTLVSAILEGTEKCKVFGIVVGKKCSITHDRLSLIYYDKPFEYECKFSCPFPSMPNYDRKAYEVLIRERGSNPTQTIYFWNVM